MSVSFEPVNNFKIKKVVDHGSIYNVQNTQGYALFPDPYCNVGVVSKKKSGKTTVIYNILRKCANKKSNVMIFSSTAFKDPVWKKITEMLENRGCNVETKLDIKEDGVNLIDEWIQLNQQPDEPDSDDSNADFNPEDCPYKCEEDLPKNNIIEIYSKEQIAKAKEQLRKYKEWEKSKNKPKKKSKKPKVEHYAKWILVFDDLGKSLRDQAINQLCKTNRHYQAMVILSSQRDTDYHPDCWAQFDFFLTFRSLNPDVMERIWEKLNLSTELEQFMDIYQECTKNPYSFLYLNVPKEEFRCGFDKAVRK